MRPSKTYTFTHEELAEYLAFLWDWWAEEDEDGNAEGDLLVLATRFVTEHPPESAPLDNLPPLGSMDAAFVHVLPEEAARTSVSDE